MGRAFPHLEMTTFSVYGVRCCPSLLMDDSGNVVQVDTVTDRIAEDVVRSICASLGSMIYGSFYPMSGRQVKELAVHDTISHTLEIGRRIRRARESQTDPIRDLLDFLDAPAEHRHARELFNGRIVDVRHETRDGWHWGQALISSGRGDEPEFSIEIQNEYLVAREHGRTVTVVPDLIAVLDAESAEPLTAEMLSYGQRVTVIGYSAAPIMRRAESLAVFGPRMFGIDEDFRGVEALVPAGRIDARNEGDRRPVFGFGMVINACTLRTPGLAAVEDEECSGRIDPVLRRLQRLAADWHPARIPAARLRADDRHVRELPVLWCGHAARGVLRPSCSHRGRGR